MAEVLATKNIVSFLSHYFGVDNPLISRSLNHSQSHKWHIKMVSYPVRNNDWG